MTDLYLLFPYRVSQKKRGAFDGLWGRAEPFNYHEQIFPCSQESNLDHKPFLIEIGLLMHLLKTDFLLKILYGSLAYW